MSLIKRLAMSLVLAAWSIGSISAAEQVLTGTEPGPSPVVYSHGDTLATQDYTVPAGIDVTLQSATSVVLRAGTAFELGSTVRVQIVDNYPPVVDITAPADGSTAAINTLVPLTALVSDVDDPVESLTYRWRVVSGPSTPPVTDAASAAACIVFDFVGTYVIELAVSDSLTTVVDQVTVEAVAGNAPPVVSISEPTDGASSNIGAPLALVAAASDPDDPIGSLTYQWSVVSGPSSPSISNATSASAEITLDAVGSYVLEVAVSDGVSSVSDQVTVNGVAAPAESASQLAHGVITDVGSDWQTVSLPYSYTSAVVVGAINYAAGTPPAVVRIRNVGADSFELRVQNPVDEATLTGLTVHWVAVEEGVYTTAADGVTMEAMRIDAPLTAAKGNWSQTQALAPVNTYTNPVVLGQVMTANDPLWSQFYAIGSARSEPPAVGALNVGKHVGADPTKARATETLGVILIESGAGTMNTIELAAGLGPDSIRGVDNGPPFSYSLSGPTDASTAIVSLASVDSNDGGWPVLWDANPVGSNYLDLAIEEDQGADAERGHGTEQVGWLVLAPAEDIAPPPPPPPAALRLAHGVISDVSSNWQTVDLPYSFTSAVVVGTANYAAGTPPVVVRVRNVGTDNFELRVQNPVDEAVLSGFTVHWLAVEEGVYTAADDGVTMEAIRIDAPATAAKGDWSHTEVLSPVNTYTSPVVLGQVMTANDPLWSQFFAVGTARNEAPSAGALNVGKHVGADPTKARATETLGIILIEAGTGTLDTVDLAAGTGGDTIRGVENGPPFSYSIPGPTDATTAIVASAGLDQNDGGWPILWAETPVSSTSINLAIEEDQGTDVERGHGSEQVAWLVLAPAQAEPPPPPPPPAAGPQFAHGVATGVGSASWQTIALPATFTDPVIIATANYDTGDVPTVVRVQNVSGTSFDLRVQNAALDAPLAGYSVHWMVVEAGVYTAAEHGITMEAFTVVSAVTAGSGNWGQVQAQAYGQSYTQPVVVGQVMTSNDPAWSQFFAQGGSQNSPPDAANLAIGKHVAGDPNTARVSETLGVMIFEAGSGTLGGFPLAAGVGGDSVKGVDDAPPYTYAISGVTNAGTAVLASAAMDGGDGGWPVLWGASPVSDTQLNLVIDEDQGGDSERKHTTEQVAWVVAGAGAGGGGGNAPPIVAITNPAQGTIYQVGTDVTFIANATDADDPVGSLTYQWSVLACPTEPTITNATSASANAILATAGNYIFQVAVSDGENITTQVVTVHAEEPNVPPTVAITAPTAGETFTTGNAVSLTTNASDSDGPQALTYLWSIVSGPSSPAISNATSASASVVFDAEGAYVIQVAVSDGSDTTTDQVSVTTEAPNVPPTVAITAPTNGDTIDVDTVLALTATASDPDGPDSGLTYQWQIISGPSSPAISGATSASASVTFDVTGSYVIEIAVSDDEDTTTDQVSVTVGNPPLSRAVWFRLASTTVTEDAGTVPVELVLDEPMPAGESWTAQITVDASSTATVGSDLTLGSATFTAGQSVAPLTISVVDDTVHENIEALVLTIEDDGTFHPTGANEFTLTITDNDQPSLAFATPTFTVTEGAGVSAMVEVVLDQPSTTQIITADVMVTGGTAVVDSDWQTPANLSLTFPPNTTSQTLSFTILNDTEQEPHETINLAVTNPAQADLGAITSAEIIIQDDDGYPTISWAAAATSANESDGSVTLTVQRSHSIGAPVVSLMAIDQTAVSGVDYQLLGSNEVTFVDGGALTQAITLSLVDDAIAEGPETVVVSLVNVSDGVLSSPSDQVVTIIDNDPNPSEIAFASAGPVSATEGEGEIVVPLTLTPAIPAGVEMSVFIDVSYDNASAGDLLVFNDILTLSAGDTPEVRLVVLDDDAVETIETATLVISAVANGTIGTVDSVQVTLTDNDVAPPVFSPGGGTFLDVVAAQVTPTPSTATVYYTSAPGADAAVTPPAQGALGTAVAGGTLTIGPAGDLAVALGDAVTIAAVTVLTVDGQTILSDPVFHSYSLLDDESGSGSGLASQLLDTPADVADPGTFTPLTSRVSPLSLDVAGQLGDLSDLAIGGSVNGATISEIIRTGQRTAAVEAQLNPHGPSDVVVTVTDSAGNAKHLAASTTWESTDIALTSSLTIRAGDQLLVNYGAEALSSHDPGETVLIDHDGNGPSPGVQVQVADSLVVSYPTAGSYDLSARRADGSLLASTSVTVLGVEFEAGLFPVEVNYQRPLQATVTGGNTADVLFEAGDASVLTVDGAAGSLTVEPLKRGDGRVVARVMAADAAQPNALIAVKEIEEFEVEWRHATRGIVVYQDHVYSQNDYGNDVSASDVEESTLVVVRPYIPGLRLEVQNGQIVVPAEAQGSTRAIVGSYMLSDKGWDPIQQEAIGYHRYIHGLDIQDFIDSDYEPVPGAYFEHDYVSALQAADLSWTTVGGNVDVQSVIQKLQTVTASESGVEMEFSPGSEALTNSALFAFHADHRPPQPLVRCQYFLNPRFDYEPDGDPRRVWFSPGGIYFIGPNYITTPRRVNLWPHDPPGMLASGKLGFSTVSTFDGPDNPPWSDLEFTTAKFQLRSEFANEATRVGFSDDLIPLGTPVYREVSNDLGFNGIETANFEMELGHAGWYTLTFDDIDGGRDEEFAIPAQVFVSQSQETIQKRNLYYGEELVDENTGPSQISNAYSSQATLVSGPAQLHDGVNPGLLTIRFVTSFPLTSESVVHEEDIIVGGVPGGGDLIGGGNNYVTDMQFRVYNLDGVEDYYHATSDDDGIYVPRPEPEGGVPQPNELVVGSLVRSRETSAGASFLVEGVSDIIPGNGSLVIDSDLFDLNNGITVATPGLIEVENYYRWDEYDFQASIDFAFGELAKDGLLGVQVQIPGSPLWDDVISELKPGLGAPRWQSIPVIPGHGIVDLERRNFWASFPVSSFATSTLGPNLVLSYNSRCTIDEGLGRGWRSNYDVRIISDTFIDETGQRIPLSSARAFEDARFPEYVGYASTLYNSLSRERGLVVIERDRSNVVTLDVDVYYQQSARYGRDGAEPYPAAGPWQSGESRCVIRSNNEQLYLDADGYLVRIRTVNNDQLTITRDENHVIVDVADDYGRSLLSGYAQLKQFGPGYVGPVDVAEPRVVSLGESGTWSFTYDADYNMTSATRLVDPGDAGVVAGETYNIEYWNASGSRNHRVRSVTYPSGIGEPLVKVSIEPSPGSNSSLTAGVSGNFRNTLNQVVADENISEYSLLINRSIDGQPDAHVATIDIKNNVIEMVANHETNVSRRWSYLAGEHAFFEPVSVTSDDDNTAEVVEGSTVHFNYDADGDVIEQRTEGGVSGDAIIRTTYTRLDDSFAGTKLVAKREAIGVTGISGETGPVDITLANISYYTDGKKRGLPAAITNDCGSVTIYQYNEQGFLTERLDSASLFNPPAESNASFSWVYSNHDVYGHPQTVTSPEQRVTSSTSDQYGRITSSTDVMGFASSQTYDARRRPTVTTAPNGQRLIHSWLANNQPASMTSFEPARVTTIDPANQSPGGFNTRVAVPGANKDIFSSTAYVNDRWKQVTTQGDGASDLQFGASYTKASGQPDYQTAFRSLVGGAAGATEVRVGKQNFLAGSNRLQSQVIYGMADVNGAGISLPGAHSDITATPNNTISYTYDDAGRVLTVTDGIDSNMLTNSYNGFGALLTTTRSTFGGTTSYTYDACMRLKTVTDAVGQTTTYDYDQAGNLVRVTPPAGRGMRVTYDRDGVQRSTTNRFGVTTSTDLTGRTLTTSNDADGAKQTVTYGGNGLVDQQQVVSSGASDPEINQLTQFEQYTPDGIAQLIKQTNHADVSLTIDPERGVPSALRVTGRANGNDNYEFLTSTEFNDDYGWLAGQSLPGRLEQEPVINSQTGETEGSQTNGHLEDAAGALEQLVGVKVRDGRGNALVTEYKRTDTGAVVTRRAQYDERNRMTASWGTDDVKTTYTFAEDPNNNFTSTVTRGTKTTTTTYDVMGNVVSRTNGEGQVVLLNEYDGTNQLISKTVDGETTRYLRDPHTRQVVCVLHPNGSTEVRRYNHRGQVMETTHGGLNKAIDHNGLGMVKTITQTADGETEPRVWSYDYFTSGQLKRITDRGGRQIDYQYDGRGAITKRIYTDTDGTVTTLSYELKTNTDESGFISETNIEGGFYTDVTEETDGQASTSRNVGRRDGRQVQLQLPEMAPGAARDLVQFAYDLTGKQTGRGDLQIDYNALGQPTHIFFSDRPSDVVTITHDAQGRVEQVELQMAEDNDDPVQPIPTFTVRRILSYDNTDRVTGLTQQIGDNSIEQYTMAYDAMDRLIRETGAVGDEVYATRYAYHPGGTLAYERRLVTNLTAAVGDTEWVKRYQVDDTGNRLYQDIWQRNSANVVADRLTRGEESFTGPSLPGELSAVDGTPAPTLAGSLVMLHGHRYAFDAGTDRVVTELAIEVDPQVVADSDWAAGGLRFSAGSQAYRIVLNREQLLGMQSAWLSIDELAADGTYLQSIFETPHFDATQLTGAATIDVVVVANDELLIQLQTPGSGGQPTTWLRQLWREPSANAIGDWSLVAEIVGDAGQQVVLDDLTWVDHPDAPTSNATYVYNGFDELQTITHNLVSGGSTVTEIDNYNYDDVGQIDSHTRTTQLPDGSYQRVDFDYTFDVQGRLVQIDTSLDGGATIAQTETMTYAPGSPIRLSRTVTVGSVDDVSQFNHDGTNVTSVIEHFGAAEQVETRYAMMGQRPLFHHHAEAGARVYAQSPRGDVQGLVGVPTEGPSGADYLTKLRYDAFGQVSEQTRFWDGNDISYQPVTAANTTQGPRYRGQWFDGGHAQLYNMRHRFYDPSIGRFISEDPARAGQNWYAYAGGDPVNRWDPSGLDWVWNRGSQEWEWDGQWGGKARSEQWALDNLGKPGWSANNYTTNRIGKADFDLWVSNLNLGVNPDFDSTGDFWRSRAYSQAVMDDMQNGSFGADGRGYTRWFPSDAGASRNLIFGAMANFRANDPGMIAMDAQRAATRMTAAANRAYENEVAELAWRLELEVNRQIYYQYRLNAELHALGALAIMMSPLALPAAEAGAGWLTLQGKLFLASPSMYTFNAAMLANRAGKVVGTAFIEEYSTGGMGSQAVVGLSKSIAAHVMSQAGDDVAMKTDDFMRLAREIVDRSKKLVDPRAGEIVNQLNQLRVHGVAPDWLTKGAHLTASNGVELMVRPGQEGTIVFKQVFSSTNSSAALRAIKEAENALVSDPAFREKLLEMSRGGLEYLRTSGFAGADGKAAELHFLIQALEKLE